MINKLKDMKDKEFKLLLTGVIVISFLTSGLFAYYTQASYEDNQIETGIDGEDRNEVEDGLERENKAEDVLTEKEIDYDISIL